MLLLLNLALPWLLLLALGLVEPSALSPQLWILQGLKSDLSLYGMPLLTDSLGIVGMYLPLAVIHNLTFLFVRLIQARMDLDFLPMIRSVLAWIGVALLGYWSWISFIRGAKYGEFHTLVLFFLPLLALCIGLAFFVNKQKGRGPAQLTALLVAWAPAFSMIATLAGNHYRPPELFSEIVFEPGGSVKGWEELDSKNRNEGYLRLTIQKENIPIQFPSLARNLKIQTGPNKTASVVESELDPILKADLLHFPEQLEDAGWRPQGENAKALSLFCASAQKNGETKAQSYEWVKANSILSLTIESCAQKARWSMAARTTFFPLGNLDVSKASQIREQRQHSTIKLTDVDSTLLTQPDWRQRKLGLSLLAQVNDSSVIPLLGKAFYDQDVEVRQTAAHALLSWGTKVEEFLTHALTDPNPYMRGDALRIVALANRHQPHPTAYKLLTDTEPYVRISAIQALNPFVKETSVLKSLIQSFEREYSAKNQASFLKDPVVKELVTTLAKAKDVRTAPTLLKAIPKNISKDHDVDGNPAHEAALALREMTNWMGVDYLQALVRRSTNLENREKALSIMARWQEPGDEASFIKAMKDPELKAHALSLAGAFHSETMAQAIATESSEVVPMQAR